MEVENLIDEMQEVKLAHPSLELPDILRIFQIKTQRELTDAIRRHS